MRLPALIIILCLTTATACQPAEEAAEDEKALCSCPGGYTAIETPPSTAAPSTPTVTYLWPVNSDCRVTSGFGWRKPPTKGASTFHKGIDLGCGLGKPVRASAPGTVTIAKWVTGYGNLVHLGHPDGNCTRYAHNRKLLVKPGEKIRAGATISEVGTYGISTGPHLHFEFLSNCKNRINPLTRLPKNRSATATAPTQFAPSSRYVCHCPEQAPMDPPQDAVPPDDDLLANESDEPDNPDDAYL